MELNQIIRGDCMDTMRQMPDASVAMTLTDIPYAVVNRASQGLRSFDKAGADVETFQVEPFVREVIRLTRGSIYIFCATEQVSEIRKLMAGAGLLTRLCIWEKTNPSPVNGQYVWLSGIECCVFGRKSGAAFNEHCKNTVWRYPTVRSKHHPTQKPRALFEYLIKASSQPGDVIFDPCIGSGTTAIAAVATGRDYLGIELDPEYYSVACSRLGAPEVAA